MRFVAGPYKGRLSRQGETLQLFDRSGRMVDELAFEGDVSDVERYLAIAEIMYHPEDPDQGAEFLELLNKSSTVTLDLTGVSFAAGITFDFAAAGLTTLAPGARVVIAGSEAAFRHAYGNGVPLAGTFAGVLDGAGETLRITDAGGRTAFAVTYGPADPWPREADGGGFSLVLAGGDPADAASWRVSTRKGGSPGSDDSLRFSGDPLADDDGNGIANLMQYATGTHAAPAFHFVTATPGEQTGLLQFDRIIGADDAVATVESSRNLADWVDESPDWQWDGSLVLGKTGRQRVTLRSNIPPMQHSQSNRYYRIRFHLRP